MKTENIIRFFTKSLCRYIKYIIIDYNLFSKISKTAFFNLHKDTVRNNLKYAKTMFFHQDVRI